MNVGPAANRHGTTEEDVGGANAGLPDANVTPAGRSARLYPLFNGRSAGSGWRIASAGRGVTAQRVSLSPAFDGSTVSTKRDTTAQSRGFFLHVHDERFKEGLRLRPSSAIVVIRTACNGQKWQSIPSTPGGTTFLEGQGNVVGSPCTVGMGHFGRR